MAWSGAVVYEQEGRGMCGGPGMPRGGGGKAGPIACWGGHGTTRPDGELLLLLAANHFPLLLPLDLLAFGHDHQGSVDDVRLKSLDGEERGGAGGWGCHAVHPVPSAISIAFLDPGHLWLLGEGGGGGGGMIGHSVTCVSPEDMSDMVRFRYRVVHPVCSAVGEGGRGVFHKGWWGTV